MAKMDRLFNYLIPERALIGGDIAGVFLILSVNFQDKNERGYSSHKRGCSSQLLRQPLFEID